MSDRATPSAPTVYTVSAAAWDAPPPTYDSIFPSEKGSQNNTPNQNGRIELTPVARSEPDSSTSTPQPSTSSNQNSGNVESGRQDGTFADAKCEPKFNILSLGVFIILDAICLIIGGRYWDECPFNDRKLPVFLVVYGILAGIFHVMTFLEVWIFSVKQGLTTEQREQKKPGPAKCCGFVFAMAGFGFFIYGCAITLGKLDSFSTDPTEDNYCHPTLFYYTFVMLVFSLIYLGLLICFGIHVINHCKSQGK